MGIFETRFFFLFKENENLGYGRFVRYGWELSKCMWGWVVCAYDFNIVCRVGELMAIITCKE